MQTLSELWNRTEMFLHLHIQSVRDEWFASENVSGTLNASGEGPWSDSQEF